MASAESTLPTPHPNRPSRSRRLAAIVRQYDTSLAVHRGLEYKTPATPAWIGKNYGMDQVFIVRNQTIEDMAIHQGASACELFAREVGPIFQHAPGPFIMDGVGPFGRKRSARARCISRSRSVAGYRTHAS